MTNADQSELKLLRSLVRVTTTVTIRLLFLTSPSRSAEANAIAALATRLEIEIERRANDVAALQRKVRLEREAKRELGVRLREAASRERSIQQSLETFRIKSQADAEAMSCLILSSLTKRQKVLRRKLSRSATQPFSSSGAILLKNKKVTLRR